MDEGASFAAELNGHMRRRGVSLDELVRRSGVPRATIHRWRRGEVSRLYEWERLLKVANTLELNRVEADRLLRAVRQPSLNTLIAEAPSDRQPLLSRWAARTRNNLPSALTSFVGREDEMLEVASLLCREDVRLVTLTGPGGAGKTRLSLQVAGELHDVFPDGIFFVPLAPLTDPALVVPTIARTLEVRDVAGQSASERLAEYLRERCMLLLLDNVEQVVDAGPEIVSLLRNAPQVKVLVTSRVPLHVTGEHERPVPLLSLPEGETDFQHVSDSPAVALLSARAWAVNPAFNLTPENAGSVAEICERLDGSPLAIELAAARLRRLSPDELLRRFPSRLDLGSDGPRDVPQRQQSLRAAIGWSYDLLSPDAQTLFRCLSVFSGGWTEDAATAICGEPDGGLAELAESQLIVRSSTDRYAMLETIREYALERLADDGQEAELRQQHALYFLILAEARTPYIPQARQAQWLEQVDREHDNLQAALGWAARQKNDELTVRLTGALWPYWNEYVRVQEGHRWLQLAIAVGDSLPKRWLGSVFTGALMLANGQSDYVRAQEYGDAALALWREIGDQHGVALVLYVFGLIRFTSGDFSGAQALYEEAREQWRSIDQPIGVALCVSELGILCTTTGRFEEAAIAFAEAYEIYEREQNGMGITRTHLDWGLAAMLQGDIARAVELLASGVEMCRQQGDNYHLHWGLFYLGASLCFAGELDAALIHLSESLRLREDKYGAAYTLLGFAAVAHRRKQAKRSARICGASMAILQTAGVIMNPVIQGIYDRELQEVRKQLTKSQFDAAFAAGGDMTVDEAVRFALEMEAPNSHEMPSPPTPLPRGEGS